MPNPKSKFSNARRDKRRSNWKMTVPTIVACNNPGCTDVNGNRGMHKPHHVCPVCGTYGSEHRQVITLRRGQSA